MKVSNSAVANAVWRDAGCGKWRPAPSDVIDVVRRDWMAWVVLKDGAWPMPWERLERLVRESNQEVC